MSGISPKVGVCHLKDHTLGLLDLVKVDVAEHEDPKDGQTHDTDTSSQHPGLRIAVGLLDGDSSGCSPFVGQLGGNIDSDVVDVGHGIGGEVPRKGLREGVVPDGTADSAANSSSGSTNDEQERKRGGDVLMVDGGQDGDLLADDEDATTDRDEDLAHDEVANILGSHAEVDHEALGEDIQGNSAIEEPLEAAGLADGPTDEQQEDTGNNVKGVADVTRLGNADAIDDHQEGGEIVGPAVVRDLIGGVQETRADNSAICEEVVLEEWPRGQVNLIEGEEGQHAEANDDHGDNIVRGPAIVSVIGEGEGEQEHGETGGEEEATEG